jgi:hypothetical protein
MARILRVHRLRATCKGVGSFNTIFERPRLAAADPYAPQRSGAHVLISAASLGARL